MQLLDHQLWEHVHLLSLLLIHYDSLIDGTDLLEELKNVFAMDQLFFIDQLRVPIENVIQAWPWIADLFKWEAKIFWETFANQVLWKDYFSLEEVGHVFWEGVEGSG